MGPYDKARERMVEKQIVARGIVNPRVIDIMRKVPRHEFVPESLRSHAYDDSPVSIAKGQTISQPYMVAIMTQSLDPAEDAKVLEVGTGSGYQSAVLAGLVRQVHSIERIPELAVKARETLSNLGIRNVEIHVGDGSKGLEAEAPFDGILVTAGSPCVPDPLVAQLKVGGRLVIPVGDSYHQSLVEIVREEEGISRKHTIGCVFVPLVGAYGWEE